MPPELEHQLVPGGGMVLPVAGRLLRLRSGAQGEEPEVTGLGRYLFVPLR